jgi:hypothetical protein
MRRYLTTAAIASQRRGKPLLPQHERRLHDNEETGLFDEMFSSRYAKNYLKRFTGRLQASKQESRVEARSNTSTVALRVVGGDEKGNLEFETV